MKLKEVPGGPSGAVEPELQLSHPEVPSKDAVATPEDVPVAISCFGRLSASARRFALFWLLMWENE